MKAKTFLTCTLIFLSIFLNAQENGQTHDIHNDSTLFSVDFYVDDVKQNKPYSIFFIDSTNKIVKPEIYCDTCNPILYIKPDYYMCDSCFYHFSTFVFTDNEYEIKIERLCLNYLYTNIELGIITEPHKLVKYYTREELKKEKQELKKEKDLPVNYKIGSYIYYYYHYHSPKGRDAFDLNKITRKTKRIQYARVRRSDSIGPSTYYNYIGNKQSTGKNWWRYWKARFIWYFR